MKRSLSIFSSVLNSKPAVNKRGLKFYLWIGLAFLVLWLFNSLINYPSEFLPRAVNETWRAVFIVLINFIFFEYSLPSIKVRWRRIPVAILFILVNVFVFSFALHTWRFIGIQLHIYTEFISADSQITGFCEQLIGVVFSLLFFGIIKHFFDYKKLKEAEQKLRIEKQAAELNYLKSQTNPHFLFNTLNNIYSLARDKSDQAPESILRLSKILRFMLYETGSAYIKIEQELKIINDYIGLEKLRYDDSLRINFTHEIENMQQEIPPLLLIPLVENAFKHGVSETRKEPFIDMNLKVDRNQIEFVVINSSEKRTVEMTGKEKIGLTNLRRQLELLYKDFNLSVQQGEAVFSATLKINLNSHV